MQVFGQILLFALEVYWWTIVAEVVISWLILFGVINVRHPKAEALIGLLHKLTEPVMKPIRKVIPPIAGLDLSPIVAIFAIMMLQQVVYQIFF